MKNKDKLRMLSPLLWIAVSVLSMFVSVIKYTKYSPTGKLVHTYAIQNLLDGTRFADEVLSEYTGYTVYIGKWFITALCVLGVAAICAALIGIVILSKQRPVKWPYVMTVFGLIGTAVPSIVIFIGVLLSVNYYPGTISCGFYPIVTPIAMIICLITVWRERRRVIAARAAAEKASSLIHMAGNL